MRILAIFLLLLAAAPLAAQETVVSGPGVTTELWEGSALTATFRVGICYRPDGQAQGVLLLRHKNGNEDTYHLYGTLKNNEFFLRHSSGHKITGTLASPDKMKGKATLGNGWRLSLTGRRHHNVPLASADCAPLVPQERMLK